MTKMIKIVSVANDLVAKYLTPIYRLYKYRYDSYLAEKRLALPAPPKTVKNYKWTFCYSGQLDDLFVNYLISHKDVDFKDYNKSNLLFLTGPHGTGKSWFLKYNLKVLSAREMAHPPLVRNNNAKYKIIHMDLSQLPLWNFDVFLHHFENNIINGICRRAKEVNVKTNQPFLTTENIKQILFYEYAEAYLEILIKDHISGLLLDTEQDLVIDNSIKEQLSLLLNEFIEQKGKKLIFSENIDRIIALLCPMHQNDKIKTAIRLFSALIAKMENENRQEPYIKTYRRTGIEVSNFLFDLMNFMAGYHELNNYQDEPVKTAWHDKYLHTSIVLENFDQMKSSYENDERANDFFDHLILRFYTDTNMRTHFPLVIETNDNLFAHKLVFDAFNITEDKITALELLGFSENEPYSHLAHIFKKEEIDDIRFSLGRHIKDWSAVTEALISNKASNINDIINLKDEYFDRERRVFFNKIAKTMHHHENIEDLDKFIIHYRFLDIFENLIKFWGLLYTGNQESIALVLENATIQSLIDSKVLYLRKHYSQLHLTKRVYLQFLKEWVKERKANMTLTERLKYRRWKRHNGVDFSSSNPIYRTTEDDPNPKIHFKHEIEGYYPKIKPEYMNPHKLGWLDIVYD